MGRHRKRHEPPVAQKPRAAHPQAENWCPSTRLELALQAEALLSKAMAYAIRVGDGDETYWPARVARADGFEVSVAAGAVELASERLAAARDELALEISRELGGAPDPARKRYRILSRVSRQHPEPPLWFLPPEVHGPQSPKVSEAARGDDTARHVANDDQVKTHSPLRVVEDSARLNDHPQQHEQDDEEECRSKEEDPRPTRPRHHR